MKVAPVSSAGHAADSAPTSRSREVAATRTPVTRTQIRSAIEQALTKVEGHRPSANLVDVLTAQASLETASGDRMYNYNFGGIKGHGPSGATAMLKTHEIVDGKEISIRDGFRAYGSLAEGALDYVRTMKDRFGGAFSPAERGDVAGFAGALKKAGYYTASQADYTRGLRSLIDGSDASSSKAHVPSLGRTTNFPMTSESLASVQGALDLERFSSIGPSFATRRHRETEAESEEDDG